MLSSIYRSAILTLILAVLLCGVYPLAVYLVGRIAFPDQSTGSLVKRDGHPAGSKLIGQSFTNPKYFHGRPSAAGQNGYDATSSSGSNLGPTSQKLLKGVEANIKKTLSENPGLEAGKVPVDLVTNSASGLDPHISPEAALMQVPRVAQVRQLPVEKVEALVKARVEPRQLGFLGEPVVNVLLINQDLDQLK